MEGRIYGNGKPDRWNGISFPHHAKPNLARSWHGFVAHAYCGGGRHFATKNALAGILTQLQEDNKQWYLVAFYSRKMIPAERNYKTHDQEYSPS